MSLTFNLIRQGDGEITVFSAKISHHLADMADSVGIWEVIWNPIHEQAMDAIEPLTLGVNELKRHPEKYRRYDSPNGWGTYDSFVPWLDEVIEACKEHPMAMIKVHTSRLRR